MNQNLQGILQKLRTANVSPQTAAVVLALFRNEAFSQKRSRPFNPTVREAFSIARNLALAPSESITIHSFAGTVIARHPEQIAYYHLTDKGKELGQWLSEALCEAAA